MDWKDRELDYQIEKTREGTNQNSTHTLAPSEGGVETSSANLSPRKKNHLWERGVGFICVPHSETFMGRGKDYTNEEINCIRIGHNQGLNGKQLHALFPELASRTPRSLQRRLRMLDLKKEIKAKARAGRPSKTTEAQRNYLLKICRENRRLTLRQLLKQVRHQFPKITLSRSTACRILRKGNLAAYVCKKAPMTTHQQRRDRLAFANKYQGRPAAWWRRVIFDDEKKNFMQPHTGRVLCRRGKDERNHPLASKGSTKHSPKICAWGCITAKGPGKLHLFTETLASPHYSHILSRYLVPSAKHAFGSSTSPWYFYSDNDPKHTSKLTKARKETLAIHMLETPSNSPDLNPIENAWSKVRTMLNSREGLWRHSGRPSVAPGTL